MTRRPDRSRLRRLALDYAEGRLARNAYLRARRDLLDALEAGQPQPPAIPASGGPPGPLPARPHKRRASWLLGAAVGLAVPLVAALLFALRHQDEAPITPAPPIAPDVARTDGPEPRTERLATPAAAPSPVPTSTPQTGPSPVDLLAQLRKRGLEEGQRGKIERDGFLEAWRRLAPHEREQARTSREFRNFEDELVSQIDGERAVGGADAAPDLVAFAGALGIRIPEPVAAPAEPPHPTQPTPTLPEPQHSPATERTPATAQDTGTPRPSTAQNPAKALPDSGTDAPTPPKPPPTPSAKAKALAPVFAEPLAAPSVADTCTHIPPGHQGRGYDCVDRYHSASGGVKLYVVAAARPFAIRTEPFSLEQVDSWCRLRPSECGDAGDLQAKTLKFCASQGSRTGQTYRPATPEERNQAKAHGLAIAEDGRSRLWLVRDLPRPQSPADLAAFEDWWRRQQSAAP